MRGGAPKSVQELLGRASITTTMRYAHLSPNVCRDAVNNLDAPAPAAHMWHTARRRRVLSFESG